MTSCSSEEMDPLILCWFLGVNGRIHPVGVLLAYWNWQPVKFRVQILSVWLRPSKYETSSLKVSALSSFFVPGTCYFSSVRWPVPLHGGPDGRPIKTEKGLEDEMKLSVCLITSVCFVSCHNLCCFYTHLAQLFPLSVHSGDRYVLTASHSLCNILFLNWSISKENRCVFLTYICLLSSSHKHPVKIKPHF